MHEIGFKILLSLLTRLPLSSCCCSEAGFQEVRLSPGLQNLLASPILPRGWWNQQLLLALKQVNWFLSSK